MKILIAGLGSIGRRHARNLIALGENDLVLFRTGRSTLPDDEFASFPVETDLAHALQVHRPQAVVVANPTALHLEAAIPAARAGAAVLLEKPVSHSMENLDVLRQAALQNGGRILVGFQFRYHPTLNQAHSLLRDGRLGQVLTVRAHWGEYLPQWHPWEDYRQSYAARADMGGGVAATLTHPLDYLRFLLGEVRSVWSFNGHISPLELDVEDAAEIGLKFASGAIGSAHVNYVQRPPKHTLEIVGTAGTLSWNNADGSLRLDTAPAPFGTYSDNPPAPVTETFFPPEGFERNQLFLSQTRHFLEVARGAADPLCTLEDGIRAQQLVQALRDSNHSGQRIDL